MRVFHGCAESVTDEGATGALRRLGEALQALSQRALAAEDFERFERAVHALFVAAEREVLCGELARLDVDLPASAACVTAGCCEARSPISARWGR